MAPALKGQTMGARMVKMELTSAQSIQIMLSQMATVFHLDLLLAFSPTAKSVKITSSKIFLCGSPTLSPLENRYGGK